MKTGKVSLWLYKGYRGMFWREGKLNWTETNRKKTNLQSEELYNNLM